MDHPTGIQFHYLVAPFFFPNRNILKTFLKRLFKKEGQRVDAVNYIFCSDDYLLTLNQDYLNHNTLTDIITFQLSPVGEELIADIYISIDRVRENSKTFKTSFSRELHRVIFHGALHLCGYKDKKKEDVSLMRSMEEFYLNLYFVPRETRKKL